MQLLYRATRDGFSAQAFHEKCDNKAKTVTLIWSDLNYVFGGYTSAAWWRPTILQSIQSVTDSTAYLFRLRKLGISANYMVKYGFRQNNPTSNHRWAIRCAYNWGPSFGLGPDIFVTDHSNLNIGSETRSDTYNISLVISIPIADLAGSYNTWRTKEIEVFQIL